MIVLDAYVQTPVTAKPKSTYKAILNFYGAPITSRMDLPDLVTQVAASLHDHGTKALLLDDITRLRMHRADDQDALDLIRAFMSMHVTLVLIGVDIPGSGLLREGRHDLRTKQWILPPSRHAVVHGLEATQTERRFDLIELDRFRYDTPAQITSWVEHLAGVENQLRLLKAPIGMLTDGTMPEYLYKRTNGVVGLLERLIEDGCREAIDTGIECLTEDLLDEITISVAGASAVTPTPAKSPTSLSSQRGPLAEKPRQVHAGPSATAASMITGPQCLKPAAKAKQSHEMRPLPRGLDPIAGESSAGYLVRLSHRLGIAPVDLARNDRPDDPLPGATPRSGPGARNAASSARDLRQNDTSELDRGRGSDHVLMEESVSADRDDTRRRI
jgi:Bacterial TniB protein